MKFLLSLKSWQLFVIFLAGMLFSSDKSYGLFISLLFWIIYTGWIYQIGSTMRRLLAIEIKPSIKYFKFACFYFPISIVIMQIYYAYLNQYHFENNTIELIATIVIACFGVWNWIYVSMYAGRQLESVIEGRYVNKSDSLKGFICFLVFPFGVWYIQPIVKTVLNKYNNPASKNMSV